MTQKACSSVDEYLETQPESVRADLERLRRIIRNAVPAAEEIIADNIPTFKLRGKTVLHFAGVERRFAFTLPRELEHRRYVQRRDRAVPAPRRARCAFALEPSLPAKLIERIAQFRAAQITSGIRLLPIGGRDADRDPVGARNRRAALLSARRPLRESARTERPRSPGRRQRNVDALRRAELRRAECGDPSRATPGACRWTERSAFPITSRRYFAAARSRSSESP